MGSTKAEWLDSRGLRMEVGKFIPHIAPRHRIPCYPFSLCVFNGMPSRKFFLLKRAIPAIV